jgi:hypothetical protein
MEFRGVGDPHQGIAGGCARRGWISLVKVIPGIRMIHAVFQNIRPEEEPVVA